ncbi:hypothetical protein [uncultured Phycicoccus sp.]|uniref:hypothetical protein n=1 Tax=uncultured Phycicoccus sp. TaxID=661422 RepID=UPI00262E9863|nr:hypothetical protein [uncultured Phycicoccus sp.]
MTSRSARRTTVVKSRHRRHRVLWISALATVGIVATSGAALSLTGMSAADVPGAAMRAVGWSAAAPQAIDGVHSITASRTVAPSGAVAAAKPSSATPRTEPSPTSAPATRPTGASAPATSGGSSRTAAPSPDRTSTGGATSNAKPTSSDPATTKAKAKPKAKDGAKADDGSSSTATTSDLCVDYLQGSLDTSSLGYRKLVASANGSDLDMWCTDRVGDLKSILAVPAL